MDGIHEQQTCEDAQNASRITSTEKKCKTCKTIKPLTDFYKGKGNRLGRVTSCKKCMHDEYLKNPHSARNRSIKWYENNKEKARKSMAEWRKNNKEYNSEKCKKWKSENPEKVKKYYKKWNDKILSSERGKLNCRMTTAIGISLRGNKAGRKWESLVGYTLEDLMNHLEKHFQKGMSWENIGEWHVDHIIPRSAFNYECSDDIDFKKCWGLKNLQPLWSNDNLRKHNKLDRPHQPSLVISL